MNDFDVERGGTPWLAHTYPHCTYLRVQCQLSLINASPRSSFFILLCLKELSTTNKPYHIDVEFISWVVCKSPCDWVTMHHPFPRISPLVQITYILKNFWYWIPLDRWVYLFICGRSILYWKTEHQYNTKMTCFLFLCSLF